LPFHDFEHGVFADADAAPRKSGIKALKVAFRHADANHARPAGIRHLTLRAVIGSVVDRLQADVILRGKLASRNAPERLETALWRCSDCQSAAA
jgi:hypothetical protein